MRTEEIKFSQEASKRIYNDYMKRILKVTHTLSKADKQDIYMEFNSHIYEAIQHKKDANEIDTLLDVIEKLGVPEDVLKPLVADKKMEQATKTFNPIHVFKALLLNLTNGFSYILFFLLYLFLFGFVFLIVAKIINPTEVGFWYKDGSSFFLGMSNKANQIGLTELLGNAFIPVMIASIILFYILITLLLKFKKSINTN
ncbi:DUF1700 domain-containing protein [Flavobacterium sp. F-65]|jgi:uncharacterized membrane protein|uniref:DUF1700 domain-containing protein n=1 Tax=Flavobacterium pisciphilum TaxID=2893755 RepID=A0ABS8MMY7_9FLAO|nr:DUF1700 domain-containing protein [Flavobacterium sp. F-65]MCC9070130.1 DUF1700 domain-containing protein [Flavobacterium sp. F-65]